MQYFCLFSVPNSGKFFRRYGNVSQNTTIGFIVWHQVGICCLLKGWLCIQLTSGWALAWTSPSSVLQTSHICSIHQSSAAAKLVSPHYKLWTGHWKLLKVDRCQNHCFYKTQGRPGVYKWIIKAWSEFQFGTLWVKPWLKGLQSFLHFSCFS